MFPSLPMSTLYGTINETWFDNDFRFAVITEHLPMKNNRMYIHHVNMIIFFMVLDWFLF